jgi:hypothetical protein
VGWREDFAREAADEGYKISFGVTHSGEVIMYFHEIEAGSYGKKK